MNAKKILDKYLSQKDYSIFSQVTTSAYSACNKLVSATPLFEEFLPGKEYRPNLLRLFVEHALNTIPKIEPAFTAEIQPNFANNCSHVRLCKGGLIITSHFMGLKNFRHASRPAHNRAILAAKNRDFFDDASIDMDNIDNMYCQLLHGGIQKPEFLLLALPTQNQQQIIAAYQLPKAEPEPVKTEQILDEMIIKLRRSYDEIKENN